MVTLVLCVDRDNDIGRKTGSVGPFIGREQNLNIANELALADPEDSDLNAIFAAVSTYDTLKKEGNDVEVVTLCGDVKVGIHSDRILNEQLTKLVAKYKPDGVILVSDGAEDEYIMPIISSKVPIKHLRKVIVKQSKSLESTYYIIVKALQDEKMSRKIMTPLALIFLGYSFSIFFILIFTMIYPNFRFPDPGTFAFAIITLILGSYFAAKAFKIGTLIKRFILDLKHTFVEAKISFFADFLALIFIIEGIIMSVNSTYLANVIGYKILLFLRTIVLWILLAIIVKEGGTNFDLWFHTHKIPRGYWVAMIFSAGVGLFAYGSLDYISVLLGYKATIDMVPTIIVMVLGLILALFAGLVHKMLKEYLPEESKEAEAVADELF